MNELANYPTDYDAARTRFRKLAGKKGWKLHALPVDGSNGLFIDIAHWQGSSEKLVVHTTGVHGVEAFPGSAVQSAFLDIWSPSTSDRPSIALIHCINPFGMHYLRRWNAQNIDLNRNFLPSYDNLPVNSLYARVDSFLNPQSIRQLSFFILHVLRLLTQYGFSSLQQAIAQGQYNYPKGLFFGGKQRSTEVSLLLSFFQQYLSEYRVVRGIDFHTGLGKLGQSSFYLENISERQQQAELLLGQPIILARAEKTQSYQTQGSLTAYLQQFYASSDYLMLTQEIGTLSPVKILRRLREENFYYQYQPDRRQLSAVRLRDAFSPENDQWRRKAVQAGVETLQRIVNYFH
ncbi:MAG: DUF2817 domain-containing protein [Bacteroidota bacterium]